MDGSWAAQYQKEETDENGNGILDPILDEEGSPVVDQEKLNRYQYNSKELTEDLGLNWNDYGVRMYDPAIARWNAVDPLAEDFYSWSPYNYVLGNPIMLVDPDGKAASEPPVNGLELFADDTGVYYWDSDEKNYWYYTFLSDGTQATGTYVADEFSEPVGDYSIVFDLSGEKEHHKSTTEKRANRLGGAWGNNKYLKDLNRKK